MRHADTLANVLENYEGKTLSRKTVLQIVEDFDKALIAKKQSRQRLVIAQKQEHLEE